MPKLKKELRETREALKSTSQKLNQQRITNSELSKNNSVLMAGLESARNEIEELQRRMQRANGKAAEYCYDTKKLMASRSASLCIVSSVAV